MWNLNTKLIRYGQQIGGYKGQGLGVGEMGEFFFFFSLNIKNYSNKKKSKETVNDFRLLIKQLTLFSPPTWISYYKKKNKLTSRANNISIFV